MAVTKYLDKTGLTYFWSKIKAWCNSVFALDSNVVHKTGNETIGGTKTFSQNVVIDKASSVLTLKSNNIDTTEISNDYYYYSHAIAFNDKNDIAIKNRIGMVRAGRSAYDANFVAIETINPTIDSLDQTGITVYYYRNGLTKSIAPSTLTIDELGNLASGRDILTRDWIPKDTRIVHSTSNENIGGTKTFTSSPIVPTPTTSDNSTKVATTAFVKAQGYLTSHQTLPTLSVTTSGDGNAVTGISVNNHAITVNKSLTFLTSHQSLSNYVTLTGAQTLSGQKTFSSSPITTGRWYCNREDPSLQLNCTEYTKGATLSAATNAGIFIHDKTTDTTEKTRLGAIRHWIDTSRSSCMRIGAYRDVANSTEVAILSVTCDYDGTKYASCPTPADNENSTKIATTAWVQKFCGTTKGYLTSHQTLPNLSITTSGSGNAVTSVTVSGHAITVNKNTTFLTAHQSLVNYLTKLTNVSEMGRYIDMHYDNDTATYDYDARIYVHAQGDAKGKGELRILASKVTADTFNGDLTGNADTATKIQAVPNSGGTYVGGAKTGGALVNATNTSYGAIWNAPTKDYRVACSTHPSNTNNVYLCYSISNSNISSNTNTIAKSLIWNADTGILTANTFSGSLSGNASTATALETARTINGVSFDGSANINISDFTRIFWSIGAYNKHASAVKGTNPSSTQYWSFGMTDKNGYADENTLGRLRTTLATDGTVSTYITAFKNVANSTASVNMGVKYDADGTSGYTFAPTPATSDNSTKIATTAYVKAQGYITSSGSITGNATTVTGTAGTSTLAWNSEITLYTVGGHAIKAKLPANPNTNTTYTFATGDSNGQIKVTPSGGSAQNVSVKGLGSAAYTASTDYAKAEHTHSYLPLAGGNLTGSIKLNTTSTVGVYKGNATSLAEFSGGSALNKGARLGLYGESHTSNAGRFDLIASNASTSKSLVGKPDGTLTWGGQSVSTSSDERIKTKLQSVPENILNAWENVEWGEFKFLEAVADKGESARLHTGLIAQAVDRAFKAKDLDACKYGILCHEEREATEDEPAIDMWTVRYTEALAMEAAYQRHKNKILENRISELENQLSSVLQTLKELKGVG